MDLRLILCNSMFFHIVFGQVSGLSDEICKSLMNSRCVNINLCQPFANLMMFFETTVETREMLKKISCGFDGATPKVCCPKTHAIPKEAPQRSILEPTDITLDPMSWKGTELAVTFAPDTREDKDYGPRYGGVALDTIWDKVVVTTSKTFNIPAETKHTTTPLSQGKVRLTEPVYSDLALQTIWDKVVEPTTILGPDKSWKLKNEPTTTTLNSDIIQGEIKYTTNPLSSSKDRQIEPEYTDLAVENVWDKVVDVEPIVITESNTLWESKKESNPTLNKDSIQGDVKHFTTPLSSSKFEIEPDYRGIAFNTIWDKVVEPTTLVSPIKLWKPINELTGTTLNSNSIQRDMEHATTPLSSSKVEQIEPGYRGYALDTIWNQIVEPITLIAPVKIWKPTNEATAASINSIEMQNANGNSNSSRIWQIETTSPTLAPDRILKTTEKPLTVISKSDVDLEKPIKKSSDFIAVFPSPPECGVSKTSFGGRVVDGVDANLGDLPWMTLLGYRDRVSVTSWNCGGSLISHHHVLTAAHCIHNNEIALYVVRLGELDLAREDEGAIPIDVLIKDKVKHELYNPKSYENDIGLLILQKDVQFTDLIKPICMPLKNELRSADLEDWRPFIAGWGKTKARGSPATRLQVLQLPVISNDVCKKTYKPYENQVIDDRVLCVGLMKGGKDSCGGDSGGPLMQPFPQNFTSFFYQIGVISYGARDCAKPGYPGVYTRITSFMTWLEINVLGVS